MRATATVMGFVILVLTGLSFMNETEPVSYQKKITIYFQHEINKKTLVLGDSVLIATGENITIEKFRYYISHISITDTDGKITQLNGMYFLVDESNPASKKIELNFHDKPISKIGFLLGVDSIRNVSGVQTGALDPLNGMFWTWNSGYIMAKMEGTSSGVQQPGHRFTHHIGGFRYGINTARNISLTLPHDQQNNTDIYIVADLNRWFKSKHDLGVAANPVCHTPGALATKFADNYSTMFSINPSAEK